MSLVAGVEPLHIACALGYTDIAVSLVRDECRNPFATQQLGACDYSSPAWLFRFIGRRHGDRLSDEDHDARKMWRDFLQLGMSEYIPGCGCSGPYPAITLATGFHWLTLCLPLNALIRSKPRSKLVLSFAPSNDCFSLPCAH